MVGTATVITAVILGAAQVPTLPGPPGQTQPDARAGTTTSPISIRFPGRSQAAPTPYEPVGGLIVFKVKVEGREVWALLDNGAERSLIDETLAGEMGFAIGAADGFIRTPSGLMPKRRVSNVSLEVPFSFAVDVPAVAALDLRPVSELLGREIDFVLGGDLLDFFVLVLDPDRRTLRLGPTGRARTGPAVASTAVDPETSEVELVVEGKPVRLMIDLGSNVALTLTPEAWARVAPVGAETRRGSVRDGNGGLLQVETATASEVTIGGIPVRDVEVNIRPGRPGGGDGTVGNGFLDRFQLILDVTQGRLWLRPLASASPDPNGG